MWVCVIDGRGVCLWSRIRMTHSVSHSMKLRRNIAETVSEVCYTTCCESSNSRPPFVSLYLLVSPDFLLLFCFPSLYRICLAVCIWSIYRCGPIHCEKKGGKKHTNGLEFNLGFYESVTTADLKAPNLPWRKQENASFLNSLGLNTSQWDTKAFLCINETHIISMAVDTMIQISMRKALNSFLAYKVQFHHMICSKRPL